MQTDRVNYGPHEACHGAYHGVGGPVRVQPACDDPMQEIAARLVGIDLSLIAVVERLRALAGAPRPAARALDMAEARLDQGAVMASGPSKAAIAHAELGMVALSVRAVEAFVEVLEHREKEAARAAAMTARKPAEPAKDYGLDDKAQRRRFEVYHALIKNRPTQHFTDGEAEVLIRAAAKLDGWVKDGLPEPVPEARPV